MPHLLTVVGLGVALVVTWSVSGTGAAADVSSAPPLVVAADGVATDYQYVVRTHTPLAVATAYVVVDAVTGEVLLEKNADRRLPIASVAKLLAAPLFVTALDASATYTVTAADVAAPEDFGALAVGQSYTVYDLLFPYLLTSSNDAAAVLTRAVDTSLTTSLASLLAAAGVAPADLQIADIAGLSPATAGTAAAVARLTAYAYQTAPVIFDITTLPQHTGVHSALINNNPLVAYPGYRGGKHGYTPEAGRTLAAVLRLPFADGQRDVVFVVLDADHLPSAFAAVYQAVVTEVERVPESGILSASL